ncbi:MAG: Tm-1-like ATP-binding domain-containing protein [Arachnia sp.]
MTTVALLGTLDTKGEEFEWLARRLQEHGVTTIGIDVGSFSSSPLAQVTSDQVIEAAGEDAAGLRQRRDRGEMMTVMGRGAATIIATMAADKEIHGLLCFGGSGGSSIAAPAMQALPVGLPKLLVSTMASGDVRPYVGESDVTLMYSVVDIAGINQISRQVLGNAAAAIAGMATYYASGSATSTTNEKPLIGISMFGLTTPAADEARATLADLGYECLVFHATGTGGRAMEKLIESDMLAGVCDLTTTELADDLVGGVLSAGPARLEMAGSRGLPQVVSLGALDMVNFGPRATIPSRFEGREFIEHNPTVTLMRTTADEMAELGSRIARKLAAALGPTSVFLPLNGVSGIDIDGGPFRDEAADQALFTAVKAGLEGSAVTIVERAQAINDPGFGEAMAQALHASITHRN